MTVTRCDNCRRKVKDENLVSIQPGYDWKHIEICQKCAETILGTLKSYEILKESGYKSLRKSLPKV